MIIVDCSAMIEVLVGRNPDQALFDAVSGDIAAPYLLDTEVLSGLRGLSLTAKIEPQLAETACQDYLDFSIDRHETRSLTGRIWALRHQFTAYDASYIALAESLGIPLVTCDAKLHSCAHHANIVLYTSTQL